MPGTNKVTLRVDWTFGFLLRLSQAELAPFMSEIPIQNQIKKKADYEMSSCNLKQKLKY